MTEGDRKLSLADSVTQSLRREIINGEILPGLRLSETWVAERFGVARPTAKAGIDRLTAEGVLRRGPHRSSFVPRLTADDVEDIYFSRGPVEAAAVTTLAARPEVPDTAERALVAMRDAAGRSAHLEHTEADVAFHRAIVSAASSERLRRMHEAVMGEAQLCIAQVRRHESVDLHELTDRHAAILDAIRRGDATAAILALHADLDGCKATLLDDITRQAIA